MGLPEVTKALEALLTPAQAAEALGISVSTLALWRRSGRIKAAGGGSRTYVRYEPTVVREVQLHGVKPPKAKRKGKR